MQRNPKGAAMTTTIRRVTAGTLAVALAALTLVAAIAASTSQAAAARHFDARILSKNASAKTFKGNTEHRGVVKFHVNGSTEFERIKGGFSGLKKGMRVEIDAKHTKSGWVAREVERDRHDD
jgi:hypothetical protein